MFGDRAAPRPAGGAYSAVQEADLMGSLCGRKWVARKGQRGGLGSRGHSGTPVLGFATVALSSGLPGSSMSLLPFWYHAGACRGTCRCLISTISLYDILNEGGGS